MKKNLVKFLIFYILILLFVYKMNLITAERVINNTLEELKKSEMTHGEYLQSCDTTTVRL